MNMKKLAKIPAFLGFIALGCGFYWLEHVSVENAQNPINPPLVINDSEIRDTKGDKEKLKQLVDEQILLKEGIQLGLAKNDPVTLERIQSNLQLLQQQGTELNSINSLRLYDLAASTNMFSNDVVIQKRIVELMKLWIQKESEELTLITPTRLELAAYLEQNNLQYAVPPQWQFRQVFIDPRLHAKKKDELLASLIAKRDKGEPLESDPGILPAEVYYANESKITRQFGESFFTWLAQQPKGKLLGPVESAHGYHFVTILDIRERRTPSLDEVYNQVYLGG